MKIPLLGHHIETNFGDPIELAKELAWEIELREAIDETSVMAALAVMNGELHRKQENRHSIIKATHAFAMPGDDIEVSLMPDWEIANGRIEEPILRGKTDSIVWVGSAAFSGFGLLMYGVDYYKPERRRSDPSTVVPLEAIDVKLSLFAND